MDMDKEDIQQIEAKYTGNTRHLSEGELAAIVNDPANDTETADNQPDILSAIVAERIADDTQSMTGF
jgi:hypothetical protein